MVKLLKSGSWALEGTRVVEMVEGDEQSFGPVENCKLIEAGWAEWIQAEEWAKAEKAETESKPARKPKAE